MKRLKKGTQGYPKEKICSGRWNALPGCGAKLLVSGSDLFYKPTNFEMAHRVYATFECPCCGAFTDVDDFKED